MLDRGRLRGPVSEFFRYLGMIGSTTFDGVASLR